jgi:hypothetical protein
MVPQAPGTPLRRLRDAMLPGPGGPAEEHLHYDRGARVWRTHAELEFMSEGAARAEAWGASYITDLQECA